MDINTMEYGQNLKDLVFPYLVTLLGSTIQLRMNHWQTTCFAEHKLTDAIIGDICGKVDDFAEAAIGIYNRPILNSISINVTDIKISTTKYVLDQMEKNIMSITNNLNITNYEDLKNINADLLNIVHKAKYLLTLN